jgi:hypothetical protein
MLQKTWAITMRQEPHVSREPNSAGPDNSSNNGSSANTELTKALKAVSDALEGIDGLESNDIERKNSDVKDMIHYVEGMTNAIEARRHAIYTSSLQFVAILLTLTGVVIAVTSDPVYNISPMVSYALQAVIVLMIIQSFGAVVLVFLYERQSKYRYPFLKIPEYSNQWKWFYRGIEHIGSIRPQRLVFDEAPAHTTKLYLCGLIFFVNKYRNENPKEELKSNLCQLYLLHVHNMYKNKFYLQLTEVRFYSHVFSLFWIYSCIIAFIILGLNNIHDSVSQVVYCFAAFIITLLLVWVLRTPIKKWKGRQVDR